MRRIREGEVARKVGGQAGPRIPRNLWYEDGVAAVTPEPVTCASRVLALVNCFSSTLAQVSS